MAFVIWPSINILKTFESFIKEYMPGKSDLIITNEFVLAPHIENNKLECDVIYQEKYGSGEPTDEMVNGILNDINGKGYQRIIAIGGGTVLDISKLLLFEEGLDCKQVYEQRLTLTKKRRLVAIPTTCGTGSEVTPISVVHFKESDTKIGMAAPSLAADESVIIEDMFKTLPYEVFAASSIDALVHAVEAYVSPRADAFTKIFSEEAVRKILKGYKRIIEQGKDSFAEYIGDFGVASNFAGIAFGNAGVASVHALSHTLGATLHIPHGKANYLVLAEVFHKYRELGVDLLELDNLFASILEVPQESAWEALLALLNKILPLQPLKEFGMSEAQIKEFVTSTIDNQQRLLLSAPIQLKEEDLIQIFSKCY